MSGDGWGGDMGSWLEREREIPITDSLFSISLGTMRKRREGMDTYPDRERLPLRCAGENRHRTQSIFTVTLGSFPRCVSRTTTWHGV